MVDFQPIVDRFLCKYFAENDTGTGETLDAALRSPFVRLYALNRSGAVVETQRLQYQHNERVQLFHWTHEGCWTELVRLVPVEQPSVFWIHAGENVTKALAVVGRLRPARQDVIIFERAAWRGIDQRVDRYFARTHVLGHYSEFYKGAFNPRAAITLQEQAVEPDPIWLLVPRAGG